MIFVFLFSGMFFQMDSDYIASHLDPQISDSGTLTHSKEMQILNKFQDFLILELILVNLLLLKC